MTRHFLLAAALIAALVCQAFAQDDPERKDRSMGTGERMRVDANEQGDSTMTIQRKPKQQQQTPNTGPIYVVPQVNTGPGRAPVIIPMQPGQPGQPGQQPPPAGQHP
jgi:hypothetical protein